MFIQLTTYSLLLWTLYAAIAFLAARFTPAGGILLGHLLVAIPITISDIFWIRSEIHLSIWNGQPDMDAIFVVGIFIRILLINAALLPLTALGRIIRLRAAKHLPA